MYQAIPCTFFLGAAVKTVFCCLCRVLCCVRSAAEQSSLSGCVCEADDCVVCVCVYVQPLIA